MPFELMGLRREIEDKLAEKQPWMRTYPALMGDGYGNVAVTGRPGYVHIRVGDSETPAICWNNRVGLREDLAVIVGYAPEQPNLFQVLTIREVYGMAGLGGTVAMVPPHHWTHEWADEDGGDDTTYIHLRQWMPLQVRVSSGLTIKNEAGPVPRGSSWDWIAEQTINLTASVPGSGGARYVLIYLNSSGVLSSRAGDIVIPASSLDFETHCPSISDWTELPLAAVQLTYGQTTITDTYDAQQIVDLRFPQATLGAETVEVPLANLADYARGSLIVGGAADWEDLTVGAANSVLTANGTDVAWSTTPTIAGLTLTGNLTVPDDGWVGLGAAGGRIIFDSTPAPDLLTFSACRVRFDDNVGIGGAPSTVNRLTVTYTGAPGAAIVGIDTSMSTTDGSNTWGLGFVATNNSAVTACAELIGIRGRAETSNAGNTTLMAGGYFRATSGGTGTAASAWGVYGKVEQTPTLGGTMQLGIGVEGHVTALAPLAATTLTTGIGVRASIEKAASAAIGTAIGVKIGDWSTSGAPTTSYALYIDTTVDIGTTKYALYSLSTSASYLAGDLGIGSRLLFSSVAGVTTEGALWADSTQRALQTYIDGIESTIGQCIFTQTASATVANTTTETTLIGAGTGTVSLPADFFAAGKTLRIVMRGYNSTANPAGTLTIRIKFGATTILATPANTATNGLSNRAFDIQAVITCRTTGATGTIFGQGTVLRSTGAMTSVRWEMVNTSTTTIDTTAAQTLNITAQWGTADAGNTITATNLVVQILN